MGRKAIICECSSNGTFLIDDCVDLGLEPVVIYPPIPDESDSLIGEIRKSSEAAIAGRAEIMRVTDMREVAARLDGCDVACVMAGSEYGVPFADELAGLLGLPGNDPSTTRDRTEKLHMHRALERAGLRHIRTAPIASDDDMRAFWKGSPVIVKPSRSGGTVGFHLCRTLDECVAAYRSVRDSSDWAGGRDSEPIAQDYIEGREYIVNTLSRDGVHRITDMWVYHKQNVGIGMAYDCAMSVTDPSEEENAVADYAVEVLRATGMEQGPAHIEIKFDGDGPVLIEINARPMGGAFSKTSLDRCLGHHITDLALRSAVDPSFINTLPEGIPRVRDFILKVMIVHQDRILDADTMCEFVRGFRSFNAIKTPLPKGARVPYGKTENLEMSPGSVELIQTDEGSALEDFALLSNIELRLPDLVYGSEAADRGEPPGIREPSGNTAWIDDEGLHMPTGLTERLEVYAWSMDLPKFYRELFRGIDIVPSGGEVVVDRRVEGMVPYGRKGVYTLMMVAGLDFEIAQPEEPIVAAKR